jgi:hypothetical protein
MMFDGWGYEMPARVIINKKMTTDIDADLAFIIHSAVKSLITIRGTIYIKMKNELTNFLIKISHNISNSQLAYINNISNFSEVERQLFISCLPLRWQKSEFT